MAYARILHQFPDGTEVSFEVQADESFPQSIAEVTAAVRRMYDETLVDRVES